MTDPAMAERPDPNIGGLRLSDPGDLALTGKQEHYLKRELISRQVNFEITELNTPTALQRFGAPFRSPLGEVTPANSELPILRYIFVNHVRKFPFLDQAKEKEFWQDRLQVFLESFATKRISSSEDRHEETKRRKLALKSEKIVELMMNSGIPTASGYEEKITFDEIEAAGGPDRQANQNGLLANVPEGNVINGWDVNVASVRQTSVKRTVRYHTHAEFIIRSKRAGFEDVVVGRRYGMFQQLHRELRNELPGKVFIPVPRKVNNSSQSTTSGFLYAAGLTGEGDIDSDASDNESISSQSTTAPEPAKPDRGHKKTQSLGQSLGVKNANSRNASRSSMDDRSREQPITLWRENQRVSLRAFLRSLLADPQIAKSKAMAKFLLEDPIKLNEEESIDEDRRRAMDEIRLEEQRRFFEVAHQRARELDVYMEGFRRDIVESNGLTKLFAEIRVKDKLSDLSVQYIKFAEWLRIEVAATIYHLFLAEDNSAELFSQGKRIHSLIPYSILKNVIRLANPATVMNGVLDLFLATPFGAKSLLQRILAAAIRDGIRHLQKSVDALVSKVDDQVLSAKLKAFVNADEEIKDLARSDAAVENLDLIVVILRADVFGPDLTPKQIEKVFNGYVAYSSAVDNEHEEIAKSAQYYAYLKQTLKLYTRQRDKAMMLAMIEEPVTLQLFRDLFSIFYEPLIRVYKSANVYNSVTDFAVFVDDLISVVEKAYSHEMATDPNVTVQSFIDLCARHEDNFYKFVHEVHIHDDGLFQNLMAWLEEILSFLRNGPRSQRKLDINTLFSSAAESGELDPIKAKREIDGLIDWHAKRRNWQQAKIRQKMAQGDSKSRNVWDNAGPGGISPKDFGIADDKEDLYALEEGQSSGSEDEDEADDALADPIATERKKKKKHTEALRRRAGEPEKPVVEECLKLGDRFLDALREVLA